MPGFVDQRRRVGDRRRDWLLAVDVAAGPEPGEADRVVVGDRGRVDQQIEFDLPQHLLEIAVVGRNLKLGARFDRLLLDRVAHRDEFDLSGRLHLLQPRQMHDRGDGSTANEANPDQIHAA